MKKIIFLIAFGLFSAVGVYQLSQNLDIDYGQDAVAAVDTLTSRVNCTAPSITGFTGDATVAVTWAAPAAGVQSTPSATLTLGGAVDGEVAGGVTPTLNATGVAAGSALFSFAGPKYKLAGLQCQSATGQMTVEAHATADTDTAGTSVYMQDAASADNAATAGKRVDDNLAAAKAPIVGLVSSLVTATAAADGTANEGSNVKNGEITNPAYELQIEQVITNAAVGASGGPSQDVTATMTQS